MKLDQVEQGQFIVLDTEDSKLTVIRRKQSRFFSKWNELEVGDAAIHIGETL